MVGKTCKKNLALPPSIALQQNIVILKIEIFSSHTVLIHKGHLLSQYHTIRPTSSSKK
ncbi:hypothetical protein RirG_200120 [Rhizophagus irregularis DAOM 197198w]|uniref:Uncharacterized protein n=1 Tax=Rhizophagus irregularis (strain DAOM 197198w) TaxID=1432141 RepID=A0A015JT46_RHIIW|nr:hypothetical protein RirG_200120 [Rhizophagus irregularis DAOM 197198w]